MSDYLNPQTPIELINIVPFNPLISKCQIKVCWVGEAPNRNNSIITKEVATEIANSLPGSPIVGHYNEQTQDFEEHNKLIQISGGKFTLKPDTQPYGFVDLNAKVWFQWFTDADGVSREYLVTEGWLWTGQYPECERVITKGNNQSMELEDKEYLDAHWTKDQNGNKQFFIINEAIISKLCILGEKYTPCFEGANITAPKVEFSFDNNFKEQLFSMMTEIKNILSEGGAFMTTNDNTPVVETEITDPVVETPDAVPAAETPITEPEVVEDPVVENEIPVIENEEPEATVVCEKCGKPVSECECPAYVLEEIAEYVELQQKYEELVNTHNALKAENETLVSFKLEVEKKEKEAMIQSFYMLSDEDKKEVIDNIDSYSLADIEAKLSILCVRNKVSFDLEDNKDPINYNLKAEGLSSDNLPEWVKAIQNHVAEN